MNFQAIVEITPQIVKDGEDEEFIGIFEGVASTPEIDLEGDAFKTDVLKTNAEKLKDKPILFGHGRDPNLRDTPIGKIIDAWIDGGVLKIKAGIYKQFKDIWEKIKSGILRGLSVGGIAKKIKRETVNVIEDAEIEEVSLAPKPVNPSAQIYHVFGKAFIVEDGVLTTIAKVDFDLPIVKRGEWDGDAVAKRIFNWAEKEDGSIDKSKASKLFLVVHGDGSKRGDYSWPVGDIIDGKPVLVSSGIITAIKYAAGARGVEAPAEVKRALEKLASRLVDEGILPEDYEVPWKREEKSAILEDIILKSLSLEERLDRLEESSLKQLSEKIDSLEKMFENEKIEKSEKLEKTSKLEAPKALVASEEVVRKTVTSRYVDFADSSFMNLHKTLRKINEK